MRLTPGYVTLLTLRGYMLSNLNAIPYCFSMLHPLVKLFNLDGAEHDS